MNYTQTLIRGQKIRLPDEAATLTVGIKVSFPTGISADLSCFGVDAADKLADERYFIFFNQKSSPENAICSLGAGNGFDERFEIQPGKIPASVCKLVFTCNIDEAASGGAASMQSLQAGQVQLLQGTTVIADFPLDGKQFQQEKALILGEIYVRDGVWRFNAVGQGFNGGLAALLKHFGGVEAEASPEKTPEPPSEAKPAIPPPEPPKASSPPVLTKVESKAPALVSLVKTAKVSLDKAGLSSNHRAKVALCLDISGSMATLYKSGQIQAFAERILALACHFDDDGSIDVFLFGVSAHNAGPMSLDSYKGLIGKLLKAHPLEGGTRYGKAIEMIRQFYFPEVSTRMSAKQMAGKSPTQADVPVFVMFVTDGSTDDKDFSERQIRMASYEPIFWQFMSIGGGQFEFLQNLDTMKDRYIDNAGFFNVPEPKALPDAELYERLVKEYPDWVGRAKKQGLLS